MGAVEKSQKTNSDPGIVSRAKTYIKEHPFKSVAIAVSSLFSLVIGARAIISGFVPFKKCTQCSSTCGPNDGPFKTWSAKCDFVDCESVGVKISFFGESIKSIQYDLVNLGRLFYSRFYEGWSPYELISFHPAELQCKGDASPQYLGPVLHELAAQGEFEAEGGDMVQDR